MRDINIYALNHGAATPTIDIGEKEPAKGTFYRTLEILMELYELIDDPRDRYTIKDELLYGNTADLKAVNEYKNIREMLIGELIKLPEIGE